MGFFVEKKSGGKTIAMLSGIGVGAALMFVLDPERGRRRRAMARDKAVSLANRTGDMVARRSRDLANRAKGVAAEARSVFEREDGDGGDGGKQDFQDREFSGRTNASGSEARIAGGAESKSRTGSGEGEPRPESRQMSGDQGKGRRVEEEGEL
ncbi:MAG: hypothetical protein ABI914_03815 [Acidobacteriota bacterium]